MRPASTFWIIQLSNSRAAVEEKRENLEGTEQKYVEKEIRIRQILEEFMA